MKILKQRLNLILFVLILSILLIGTSVSADDGFENNYEELYKLQPGITMEEVKETVKVYAEDNDLTEMEATELILEELNEQIEADREESAENSLQGGSSGNKKLPLATKKGIYFIRHLQHLGYPMDIMEFITQEIQLLNPFHQRVLGKSIIGIVM